jgi:hypothetical protein
MANFTGKWQNLRFLLVTYMSVWRKGSKQSFAREEERGRRMIRGMGFGGKV